MQRRPRACEACQKLKAKCDSSAPGPCDRCERMGIPCVPAPSRLQRDRIAELEAQVEHFTRRTPPEEPSAVAFLDARIRPDAQRRALAAFASDKMALWPVLAGADLELDRLRVESPHLLLAIMAFPADTRLPAPVQEQLVVRAMAMFGEEVIAKGNRSLEMVKAPLTAAFWFRLSSSHAQYGHCYQLIQLAVDMAIDIGIAGPRMPRSPPAYFSQTEDPGSLESRRTWIACFLAASAQAMCVRRPPSVPWSPYLEECARCLDETDGLLTQTARVMSISIEAASRLGLCDPFAYKSVEDASAQIAVLRDYVSSWQAQLPTNLANNPILAFWREVALVHIHEMVLHTSTNKSSFAGPYVPEKIAVTDFAVPEPTAGVAQTLHHLVEACHRAVDHFTAIPPSVILGLPSLSIGPALLHAHFVLAQAHVAVTGPGNTLSQILTPADIALSPTMQKLEDMSQILDRVDAVQVSFTTLALQSLPWMRAWLTQYSAITRRYRESAAA